MMTRWKRRPQNKAVEFALRSAPLLVLLSGGSALAENQWGGIGGGWKSLDGSKANADVSFSSATRETISRAIATPASIATSAVEGANNRALTRAVASRYANHAILKKAGVDPREFVIFFETMIKTESAFNERALSKAGAIGLAQLMPDTARALRVDPHDPVQNLDGGARYLIAQIAEFGALSLAVAAYNAGPQAVRNHGGIPPFRETERHVAKVMAGYEIRWRQISSQE